MGFLQHYEEEGRKSLSVCFCLLDQMSSEDEDSLRAMQREMTESCMKIRQSYVFGDQTVNASEFTEFRPGFYKRRKSGCVRFFVSKNNLLLSRFGWKWQVSRQESSR